MKKILIIICFLAVGLLNCKRTPKQVQQDYQRVIAPSAENTSPPTPPPKWPGDVKTQQAMAEDIFSRNFLVAFDTSGSMEDSDCSGGTKKITAAQRALKIFAQEVKDNDNLGLMIFNSGGKLLVPLGPAKNNRAAFIQKAEEMKAGGNTWMSEAVADSFKELTRQGQIQLGYGSYYLVMVTDGQATLGHDPTADINYLLDSTPIMVYGIGFCIKGDHPLNQAGRTIYREASNPAELSKALTDVLAESQQYKSL